MSRISELLSELVKELNERGSNVGKALKPGIPREMISTSAAKFPYPLTSEVYDLFETCNGLEARIGYDDFLMGFRLLQLDEAVGFYGYLMDQRGDPDDDYYRPTWFPLMSSDSGGVKAVECASGRTLGCIVDVDAESGNSIQFSSIETMLVTIIQCWREGAFVADRHFVDINADKLGEVYDRLNQNVPDL